MKREVLISSPCDGTHRNAPKLRQERFRPNIGKHLFTKRVLYGFLEWRPVPPACQCLRAFGQQMLRAYCPFGEPEVVRQLG